jgi:aspartyl-tRNA(Asn)/glutamyl-tRNA(Gln) amidotransferase subunit B
LKSEDAETLIQDLVLGPFFDEVIKDKEKDFVMRCANYITSDVVGIETSSGIEGVGKLTPESFIELIEMSFSGVLSSRGTKDTLSILMEKGGDPVRVAEENGLIQKSDEDELLSLAERVISENEKIVAEVKRGKESAIQSLVGAAMKLSRGSANPILLQKLFREKIIK